MPRGYPDYFGQSVFMKYGGAIAIDIDATVEGGDTDTILTLSAKGRVYWGFVDAQCPSRHVMDNVKLYVDSQLLQSRTFDSMRERHLVYPEGSSLYLVSFDAVAFRYIVQVSTGITFDESIRLDYQNIEADDAILEGGLIYAGIS